MPNENYLFGCPSDIYRCGGIAPVKATDDMTVPVGQRNGLLFTKPELPHVTPANNGQVLTVVDGEWGLSNILAAEGVGF